MSKTMKLMAMTAVCAAGAATVAMAQPPGAQDFRGRPGPVPGSGPATQLNVFLRPNYQGPSTVYNGPVERAPPLITPLSSIQVRGFWQFCSGANFSGACTTTDRDVASVSQLGLRTLGSFRPYNSGPLPPPPPPQERGDNPNLRGVSSTFFAKPAERGFRVAVDEDRNGPGRGNGYGRPGDRVDERDVQREADRFCRSSGYGSARYSDSEQVGRRTYLADVLCVRDSGPRR